MLRALVLAAVLCTSFEVSGLAVALGCDDVCEGEPAGAPCAPNCACCALPKTLAPRPDAAGPVLGSATLIWAAPPDEPASADPRDITHVPKPLLA